MLLIRTAKSHPKRVGGFWTNSRAYAVYIHPRWPVWRAELSDCAKVRYMTGSPSKSILVKAQRDGVDVMVFKCWDWNAKEFVVINPRAIENVRRYR